MIPLPYIKIETVQYSIGPFMELTVINQSEGAMPEFLKLRTSERLTPMTNVHELASKMIQDGCKLVKKRALNRAPHPEITYHPFLELNES